MFESPTVLSGTDPVASARNTFTTQVETEPAGTGSGGPKTQRGSGLQRPVEPAAQSLSVVHAAPVRVQCLLANGPNEQSVPIGWPP
jgi:hypothetical protein